MSPSGDSLSLKLSQCWFQHKTLFLHKTPEFENFEKMIFLPVYHLKC